MTGPPRPMNEVPSDVPFLVVALLVVSATVLGVVLALPHSPPPDAERVAAAIDSVAASPHAASVEIPLEADSVRVGRHQVGLRGAGGTAHAEVHYGPVTAVQNDSRLSHVLHGTAPADEFASPGAFRAALERTRMRPPIWRPAGPRLVVRRVHYGEVNGVLVGR